VWHSEQLIRLWWQYRSCSRSRDFLKDICRRLYQVSFICQVAELVSAVIVWMLLLLLLLLYRWYLVTVGSHNFVKDIIVAVSVVVAVGGCYFAYSQHRRAQAHVQRLMKDLSSLQNSEDALSELQEQ